MRILYFSDRWGDNVMGTKRSIFEELKIRGYDTNIYNYMRQVRGFEKVNAILL